MALSQGDLDRVRNWVLTRTKGVCPTCGGVGFEVNMAPVPLHTVTRDAAGGLAVDAVHIAPVAAVTCHVCANVRFFLLAKMGVDMSNPG